MGTIHLKTPFYLSLAFLCLSCQKDATVSDTEAAADPGTEVIAGEGLADWTTETHSNEAVADYSTVFDQSKVNRLDIVLSAEEYATMQSDLAGLAASSGGPGGGGPGGGGGGNFADENPVYVAADLFFNGIQWYEVGLRYKGNSSLYSSYQAGIGKLPLRLKFDKFEDEYPEIKNQRFYGFKDISLSNNYKDASFMREKTATDIFREFGVKAPRSAYYEVYVDAGEGPTYFGLYTMVEVVFDTMLAEQFGSDSGNCYKPDGEGARFGATGFNLDDFEKKTNEDEADWSDIQELYDVLHAATRTTDGEQWKTDLEAVFDVDGFMKYLAVNNTIQNWDTYGRMTHNYYLYHDPADGLIKWIPWDNNEAFTESGPQGPLSLGMDEVTDDWPLISYLIAVDDYRAIYDNYVAQFIEGTFEPSKMDAQYSGLNGLISSSATTETAGYTFLNGSGNYASAIAEIKAHCVSRNAAAIAYLE